MSPYIPEERRDSVYNFGPENVGDLTYLLSKIIEGYRVRKGDRYQTFAEIIAALDCSKEEFRRVVVNPYEDRKLNETAPVHRPIEGISNDRT